MNLLQRYVSHGIAIGLLVFIMLAFNLSVLARTSEKRVLRVAFPQVVGMSWTAEDGSRHGMLVDYLNEIAKYTGWEYEYIDTKGPAMLNEFVEGKYELMGGNYYIPGLGNIMLIRITIWDIAVLCCLLVLTIVLSIAIIWRV